jgi:hypothetical protein
VFKPAGQGRHLHPSPPQRRTKTENMILKHTQLAL